MNIILLGPPGSGKGTQAHWLTHKYKIPKISTGDILRAAVAHKSALGLQAQSIMAAGALVSDDLIIAMVNERLQLPDCNSGCLFDGFPRTLTQAHALMDGDMKVGPIHYVIELLVPDEEIVARLTGRWVHAASGRTYHALYHPPQHAGFDDLTGEPLVQRPDDVRETVIKRLQVYREETQPLTRYFQQCANHSGKSNLTVYIAVDGCGTVEDIQKRIEQHIEQRDLR